MLNQELQQALCLLDSGDRDYLRDALLLLARYDSDMLRDRRLFTACISRLIAEIDTRISRQLSALLHHPDFTRLESAWRGAETLVSLPVNYHKVRVKLLDVSWDELSQELNTAVSLRRTVFYNLIGNRELNTSGGQPFGMLVVDHPVSMSLEGDYDDLYTLELLARLGELCLCPFILSPESDFFGEPGADWLSDTSRIQKVLEGPEYVAWQRLRSVAAARFIGLTLPRIRLREPYGVNACKTILFRETSQVAGGLWGSSAFLFATIAIREYNRINWFGFMKSRWQDKYSGSLVNVPPGGIGSCATYQPTPDVRLFTDMGIFYTEQGFIPLCHSSMTDKYFFRGNRSIWNQAQDDADVVAGQIQTTLMICRIAHYLKVQIRGMIGNFQNAEECELYLNNWLERYTSNLFNADEATLAKYPLSKSRVEVKELGGQHGRYVCNVVVQPQYQFDNVCGEVLLSTDLSSGDGTGLPGGGWS